MDIKKIRKELKISQEEFGKLIGVSRQTIINWEQGTSIPESKMEYIRQNFVNKDKDDVQNLTSIVNEPNASYQTKDDQIAQLNRIVDLQKDYIEALKTQIELLREKLHEIGPQN